MKKILFLLLMTALPLVGHSQTEAQAYAVYKDGVLTFYFDGKRGSRSGDTYSLTDNPDWYSERESIYKIEVKSLNTQLSTLNKK